MLNALQQTNSYNSTLNSAVSEAVSGAKPELVAQEKKSERATQAREPVSTDKYNMTLSLETVNKAIDVKITEYFSKYPNGGSDQDFRQFIDSAKNADA